MSLYGAPKANSRNNTISVQQKKTSRLPTSITDTRPEALQLKRLQPTIQRCTKDTQLSNIHSKMKAYAEQQPVAQLQKKINSFYRTSIQRKASVNINDDKDLEREADVMGSKAMQMKVCKEQANAQLQNNSIPTQPSALLIQKQVNNTGLPNNLKTGIESLSGYSMDDVKVHYNSPKPAQLQAHAYAQGTDIHLGAGQEKHLPHEAWHVVQQKQGRVRPTMQMKENKLSTVIQRQIVNGFDLRVVQSYRNLLRSFGASYENNIDRYIMFLCKEVAESDNVNVRDNEAYNMVKKYLLGEDIVVPEYFLKQIGADKKEEETEIVGGTYSAKPGQINNVKQFPRQGLLGGVTFNGAQVYHIKGRYPDVGKPLWYINPKGQVVLLGMYKHPGQDNSVYNKMEGIGPKTINT